MASAAAEAAPHALNAFKVGRTQARPTRTLFGTVLEHVDKAELDTFQPVQDYQMGARKQADRYPIPLELQGHLTACSAVNKAHCAVGRQKQRLGEAQRQLKEKELKALYFQPDAEEHKLSPTTRHSCYSHQDLQHAKDMNAGGPGPGGSYNHHKYASKPPTHNYSLMGDPFTINGDNDFGWPPDYDPDPDLLALNMSNNSNIEKVRLGMNPVVNPDIELPLLPRVEAPSDIPPNIRYLLGSKVCQSLLDDADRAEPTIAKFRKREKKLVYPPTEGDTTEYDLRAQGSHYELGHVGRFNLFPSHSVLKPMSTLKRDHNDTVYLRRMPVPKEHRLLQDEYGKWCEQNIVREKMRKQWDSVGLGKNKG